MTEENRNGPNKKTLINLKLSHNTHLYTGRRLQ